MRVADALDGVVSGAVVDDEGLEIGVVLGAEGVEADEGVSPAVPVYGDADEPRLGSSRAHASSE